MGIKLFWYVNVLRRAVWTMSIFMSSHYIQNFPSYLIRFFNFWIEIHRIQVKKNISLK
jgi:hypothetical protein